MEIYQKEEGGEKERLGEKIGLETWKMHFMTLLKGKDEDKSRNEERERGT